MNNFSIIRNFGLALRWYLAYLLIKEILKEIVEDERGN